MSIVRLFVEKKPQHRSGAKKLMGDIQNVLGIAVTDVRIVLRYDIEGLDGDNLEKAKVTIFSEPPVDNLTESKELVVESGYQIFGSEYLPGQYDQRADSACQCVQLLTQGERPTIRMATLYLIKGASASEMEKIKDYTINPVEARECSLQMPQTLVAIYAPPAPVKTIENFTAWSESEVGKYHDSMGFAMAVEDLLFVQKHFKNEKRNPTETELKVIDTYWSDHCRHTTFMTRLDKVTIKSAIPQLEKSFDEYNALFKKHYANRPDKYPSLMDMATMSTREMRSRGKLENLDESEEINACSIKVTAEVDGKEEDWLVMFKNETHNHPTEIEPFGGAATCLGGAIRDPLSGRVYVYQAMRITGAGDINLGFNKTMKGKLPQRVISKTAAAGFSSYGNQIGLATGIVREVYHKDYVAKRLETGFVVGAAPAENVVRERPSAGDVVVLIGGETGRDGCGGATGSSKAHTIDSIDECGAEVQKGNPLTERKIQRLFRNEKVTKLIKRCNDFGAGGVSVAIGELSDGLDIDLDKVPKKYQGLNATETAISESQERMAVVVKQEDADKIIEYSAEENLTATIVATITDTRHMRMFYGGNVIVDLSRDFLDTNGVAQKTEVEICDKPVKFFETLPKNVTAPSAKHLASASLLESLEQYNVASQKGLGEIYDSSIGAGTIFMPFGGKNQLTPSINMAAKLPVTSGETDTATICSWGYDPFLMSESPFTGAIYSILLSVVKVVAAGVELDSIRLTLQEFFERLRKDPKRWGKPTSALLGALHACLELDLAAIGGKDSMSGSFEKVDVPPTLISFALGMGKASELISNVISNPNAKLYRYNLPRTDESIPKFKQVISFLNVLSSKIKEGKVKYVTVVENGGAASAIAKSCMGNGYGFEFAHADKNLFTPLLCDMIIATDSPSDFEGFNLEYIGHVKEDAKFTFPLDSSSLESADEVSVDEAIAAFTKTFEKVYPTTSKVVSKAVHNVDYAAKKIIIAKNKIAKPKVFMPVFPGTNCEYDTARQFMNAGAEVDTLVIKNRNESEIAQSVSEIARRVKECNILAFPGGFSGGDEPDGSGKFIATTFRNGAIEAAVNELLNKRDGLAIGICNGFQALIKLGLLPNGKIMPMTEQSPTLTFNDISRHVSTVSYIRASSNLSPWMKKVKVGEVYAVAVSHGEGKFIASEADIAVLEQKGQIATQYVDLSGNATMASPFNPNGSYMAIEGITSPNGRVIGKMGHSERIGANIMKNIDVQNDMQIFLSGVEYFK